MKCVTSYEHSRQTQHFLIIGRWMCVNSYEHRWQTWHFPVTERWSANSYEHLGSSTDVCPPPPPPPPPQPSVIVSEVHELCKHLCSCPNTCPPWPKMTHGSQWMMTNSTENNSTNDKLETWTGPKAQVCVANYIRYSLPLFDKKKIKKISVVFATHDCERKGAVMGWVLLKHLKHNSNRVITWLQTKVNHLNNSFLQKCVTFMNTHSQSSWTMPSQVLFGKIPVSSMAVFLCQ